MEVISFPAPARGQIGISKGHFTTLDVYDAKRWGFGTPGRLSLDRLEGVGGRTGHCRPSSTSKR